MTTDRTLFERLRNDPSRRNGENMNFDQIYSKVDLDSVDHDVNDTYSQSNM